MVEQRLATIQALAPRQDERILDIGTGPGLLALELAEHVAPLGHVTGIDVSTDMLAVAERHRQRSAHRDLITFRHGDAGDLPFDDAAFDALTSTQVYEYVDDIDHALEEAHRVLRGRGRLLVLDTDWDSLVWGADDRARMRRVIEAWTQRFADPHLPTTLRRRLGAAGFLVDAVQAIPVLNADFARGHLQRTTHRDHQRLRPGARHRTRQCGRLGERPARPRRARRLLLQPQPLPLHGAKGRLPT